MAKLTNTKFATFDRAAWGNKRQVTVGNNRVLVFSPAAQTLTMTLHGHSIATLHRDQFGTRTLTLDPCGHWTRTTAQAMRDAMELFNIMGGASFAKGEFTARAYVYGEWKNFRANEGGTIEIVL